jgi:hypothetical protein
MPLGTTTALPSTVTVTVSGAGGGAGAAGAAAAAGAASSRAGAAPPCAHTRTQPSVASRHSVSGRPGERSARRKGEGQTKHSCKGSIPPPFARAARSTAAAAADQRRGGVASVRLLRRQPRARDAARAARGAPGHARRSTRCMHNPSRPLRPRARAGTRTRRSARRASCRRVACILLAAADAAPQRRTRPRRTAGGKMEVQLNTPPQIRGRWRAGVSVRHVPRAAVSPGVCFLKRACSRTLRDRLRTRCLPPRIPETPARSSALLLRCRVGVPFSVVKSPHCRLAAPRAPRCTLRGRNRSSR